ncbi:hypothetical protein EON66_07035 [archaeon]|nr:MAG: hypothetical protein EON66_07035 [archaeon]
MASCRVATLCACRSRTPAGMVLAVCNACCALCTACCGGARPTTSLAAFPGARACMRTHPGCRLIAEDCAVLTALGRAIPFEIAVGLNGVVWIHTATGMQCTPSARAAVSRPLAPSFSLFMRAAVTVAPLSWCHRRMCSVSKHCNQQRYRSM